MTQVRTIFVAVSPDSKLNHLDKEFEGSMLKLSEGGVSRLQNNNSVHPKITCMGYERFYGLRVVWVIRESTVRMSLKVLPHTNIISLSVSHQNLDIIQKNASRRRSCEFRRVVQLKFPFQLLRVRLISIL